MHERPRWAPFKNPFGSANDRQNNLTWKGNWTPSWIQTWEKSLYVSAGWLGLVETPMGSSWCGLAAYKEGCKGLACCQLGGQ